MGPREHIIVSTVSGGIAYLLTKSFLLPISMIVTGIFIDLDHVFEYFINEKKIKLDIKDFFHKCEQTKIKNFHVPLHSYELFIILAVVTYFYPSPILLGMVVGGIIHLLGDALFNRGHLFTYFFIYRWIKRFDAEKLFKISETKKSVNYNKITKY